jgi:C-terminal processing protease CtpA/Prc
LEQYRRNNLRSACRTTLAEADAHVLKRVVIDLRQNGGGDSRVISPLKSGLASRRKSIGHVYVLIGPATFSSAVDNATVLRRDLSATLVGEPSGGKPGGYGEIKFLTLPNSKLVVQYTTKRFGPSGDAAPSMLQPDLPAPRTLADALTGRDPALAAAIASVE